MKQRRVNGLEGSAAKARNHALVNFARDAHVVEIVFANLGELAGLIKIKNLAAFDFGRLA